MDLVKVKKEPIDSLVKEEEEEDEDEEEEEKEEEYDDKIPPKVVPLTRKLIINNVPPKVNEISPYGNMKSNHESKNQSSLNNTRLIVNSSRH